MTKNRSPDRLEAEKIYLDSKGTIKLTKIAERLNRPSGTIRGWKTKDDWDYKLTGVAKKDRSSNQANKTNSNKKGAPKGNRNAIGNAGGNGGPINNKKAEKHGFFSKNLPKETYEVMEEIKDKNILDIMWENIIIQYTAIIRAQKIMYVKDKEEIIKELKKKKETSTEDKIIIEEEWELQFAWDRQSTFLNAQSRAMAQLTNMIKRYEEMLNKDWSMSTEEQRLRIERMKEQIKNPELQHRKEVSEKKLELEKEKLEHIKKLDEMKNW